MFLLALLVILIALVLLLSVLFLEIFLLLCRGIFLLIHCGWGIFLLLFHSRLLSLLTFLDPFAFLLLLSASIFLWLFLFVFSRSFLGCLGWLFRCFFHYRSCFCRLILILWFPASFLWSRSLFRLLFLLWFYRCRYFLNGSLWLLCLSLGCSLDLLWSSSFLRWLFRCSLCGLYCLCIDNCINQIIFLQSLETFYFKFGCEIAELVQFHFLKLKNLVHRL